MITPVILCGGIGSRLWPVSRSSNPKQFLKVDGINSLFQKAIQRVSDSSIFSAPIIVCSDAYKFKVAAELEEIGVSPETIIVEPEQKNTCPAISLAAQYMKGTGTMLVLPSDHLIKDDQKFIEYIKFAAKNLAKSLMTFGIKPTYPATGYGYIEEGEEQSQNIYKIKKFIEKPDQDRAINFINSGCYYWNSGMFLLDVETYLAELNNLKPDLYNYTKQSIESAQKVLNFIQINKDVFAKCENISIDYAIFEATAKSSIMPVDIDWCDLGSWKSFYDHNSKDSSGNVLVGNNITNTSSTNCLVYSDSRLHTVLHKVDNLSIIVTDDALLVINKDHTEEVKDIHSKLKSQNNSIVDHSNKHYRPWGSYEDLFVSKKYRVKIIQLNPHSQISLQYHNKRAEHWVITQGKASVTKGEETFWLNEDESVYIPVGVIHRVENPSDAVLCFVEVQVGEEVIESDIVRIEDKYARVLCK